MTETLIQEVEKSHMRSDLPDLRVGDTVDVHVRIIEGNKERIQIFNGVIMRLQGRGLTRVVTVRRIVANEGVERTFPLHSPKIAKIEVIRQAHVRRAKLFYLRERVGKSRRLRDRRRGLSQALPTAEVPATDKPADQPAEAKAANAEASAQG